MKSFVILLLLLQSSLLSINKNVEQYFKDNGFKQPWQVKDDNIDQDSFLVEYYCKIAQAYSNQPENDSALVFIEKAEKVARLNEFEELYGKISFTKAAYYYYIENFKNALINFQTAEDELLKSNSEEYLALTYSNTAIVWSILEDYEKFLEYFNKAILINEKFGRHDTNILLWKKYAEFNLKFGDTLEAINGSYRVLYSGKKTNFLWQPYATNEFISLMISTGKLDTAEKYLNDLSKVVDTLEFPLLKQKFYRNWSELNFKIGNIEQSLKLLENGHKVRQVQYYKDTSYYLFQKAKILYAMDKYIQAKQSLDKIELEKVKSQTLELKVQIYDLYKKIYTKIDDASNKNYYDSLYKVISDSILTRKKNSKTELLQIKLALKQKQLDYEEAEEKRKLEKAAYQKKKVLFILVIVIILSILIFILIRFVHRNKINTIKKEAFEKEKQNLQSLIEEKEKNLRTQTSELSRQIEINKELQKKYQQELEKNEKGETLEEIVSKLKDNSKSKENWNQFEVKFLEIYPDFFNVLKSKHPKLSPSELKVLSFIKMNFNSKEIANVFGIESASIDRHRSNIRKKTNLERGKDLLDFLSEFGF